MVLTAGTLEQSIHGNLGADELAELIENIGLADLDGKLYNYLRSITGCNHVTAFHFIGGESPKNVLAQAGPATSEAKHCARRYVDLFWRFDPVVRGGITTTDGKLIFAQTSATDLPDKSYRDECYTQVGISNRLSINSSIGHDRLSLNIYNGEREHFSDQILDRISSVASIVLAILRRHLCKGPAGADASPSPESYSRMLQENAPGLTDREREVCVHVLRGLTSEGIALTLGISINTVLTYRKRAYSHLGISSQNELMRLVAFGSSSSSQI